MAPSKILKIMFAANVAMIVKHVKTQMKIVLLVLQIDFYIKINVLLIVLKDFVIKIILMLIFKLILI